jgi:hypothetical protein
MLTSTHRLLIFALVCAAPFAGAQQPTTPPPSGTVTGHVTCGDTQRPARFAQVMLFAVPTTAAAPMDPNAKMDDAAIAAAMKSAMSGMNNMVMTQTGLDGSYSAASVAPGDYYVFATVAGYVQPNAMVQAALDAGADPKKPIPGIPMVHVVADRSVSSDVTMQRGGAISGKVVWDDGSPATHVVLTAESTKSQTKPLPPEFSMLMMSSALAGSLALVSDDLGNYRIAGLAPGEYRLKATLQVSMNLNMQGGGMNLARMMQDKPLIIYAPSTLHKSQAAALTVKAGDELRDQIVTLNLGGMHSVSGSITSVEDHHGINSASIELTDVSDKDVVRSAGVDASGNFSVSFVPPGTYNMEVSDAADTQPSTKKQTGLVNFNAPETLRSYEDAKQSVIVGESDVTGQNVALTPSKTVKKDVDLNKLLNMEQQ